MDLTQYSAEWCERADIIAGFIEQMFAIHGGKHCFAFSMLCVPDLIKLDAVAVDAAFTRLLESKKGPFCYGLIYQEVRRVCVERGLPDPDGPEVSAEAALLEWPTPNTRVN